MSLRNNREERLAYYRQYNAKRAEERKQSIIFRRQKLEEIYGNVCSICGEKGFRLELHHHDFDGPEKRKVNGVRAEIDRAIEERDKMKYSILCHRCHDHLHRKLHQSESDRNRKFYTAHRAEILRKRHERKLRNSQERI